MIFLNSTSSISLLSQASEDLNSHGKFGAQQTACLLELWVCSKSPILKSLCTVKSLHLQRETV